MELPKLYSDLETALAPLDVDKATSRNVQLAAGTATYRAPSVDLGDAIKALQQLSQQQNVNIVRIEIYADTLTSPKDVYLPDSCSFVTMTARRAFVDTSNGINFHMQWGRAFGLRLVKDDQPLNLKCNFFFNNGKGSSQTMSLGPGILGNTIILDKTGQPTLHTKIDPLFSNFNYLTAAEQISSDGELRKLGFDQANDNLPKLLSFQLLLAAQNQDLYPDLNFEIAHFVAKVTAQIPKALDYNSQASTILATCVLDNSSTNGAYLSPLNIALARDKLEGRLKVAKTFDEAYQALVLQSSTTANIATVAQATLKSSQDANTTYALMANLAQGNYESAQGSLLLAQQNFNDLQATMPDVQKAFQDGIEAYKTRQIVSAVIDGLTALVLIGGSIAIAVVAPPAGAAVATGAAAEIGATVEAGADVAKNVSNIVSLINKLKVLFGKIKPALEKIGTLVQSITKVVEMMRTFKRIDSNDGQAQEGGPVLPVTTGDDTINMTADWDTFGAEMASMGTTLVSEKIAGSREFFLLMADLTIRAKAMFAAQSAVSMTGQAYCKALAQVALGEKQTADWQNAIDKLHESEENYKIFRLAMLDKLLQTRSWVVYDFRQYVSAYAFYSLQSTSPITLNALKSMGDLEYDAASLQDAIDNAKSTIRSQSVQFTIKDSDKVAAILLNDDWKKTLNTSHSFIMTVLPTAPIFDTRARIRILNFSIFLDGVPAPADTGYIRLDVHFGRNLQDLSMRQPQQTLTFIGAETTADFEYASPQDVRVAGQLLYPDNAVAITPFTTWTVNVAKDVDCSAITGLTVKLQCEFSTPS